MTPKVRGVRSATLVKKVARWKPVLKLSDWDISIRYATKKEMENAVKKEENKEFVLAFVQDCDTSVKRALILVNRDYHNGTGYKTSWNIDTLILHELIHIVVWMTSDILPKNIAKHNKVHDFEEFVCDSFADIIYCSHYNKL